MKNLVRPRRSATALFALVLTAVMGLLVPMNRAQAEPIATDPSDPASLLTVIQHFTQPAGVDASDSFSYELTALPGTDGAGDLPAAATGSTYNFTMSGETTADPFGAIVFTRPGVFNYSLRQINAGTVGYTYDATDYRVTVEVANQADGGFAITEATAQAIGGEGKAASLVFSCLYAVDPTDPTLMPDPKVNKTVQGPSSLDEQWEFELTAQDPANPMPEGSDGGVKTITIIGAGSATFGQWSYAAVGTYVYTVTEKNTDLFGYTYDESVYTITDYVTPGDEGRLVLERVLTNGANKNVESFDFVNEFSRPIIAPLDPFGPLASTGGALLGPAGTDALPFVSLMAAALLGAGGCLLLMWRRRTKDDDEAPASAA